VVGAASGGQGDLPAVGGYRVRRPRRGDFEPAAELVRLCEEADYGASEHTQDDLEVSWRFLDLERDVWVVEDESEDVVAVAALRASQPVRMFGYVAVAPAHAGRGLGSLLLGLVEERANACVAEVPSGSEFTLNQDAGPLNPAASALLEANGYAHVRRFWEMGIELKESVPEPRWPDGMRVETLVPGGEREVYDVLTNAFRDHWGFVEYPFEEWRAWMVDRKTFDPSLWFLVRDDSALVGASVCSVREDTAGWVNILGVDRVHRRLGLGTALLRHSFREFRSRGLARAGLGVDSENLTGATRLYERAGMRVVRHSDTYQKVLRPAAGPRAARSAVQR
jgi:mycothiol synthase